MAHGVETLVEASRIAGPDVVQTTIAGAGAELERVRGAVAEAGATNVVVLGLVRPDEVPPLYADADAAVVLLRDLPVFRGALPTKLCEAMAAGRPVLLSAEGESADAVRGAEAGIVVPPGDPAALADAIRRLHSDRALGATLGASGRVFAEARLGADRAADAWAGVLREAAAIARASAGRSGRAAGARRPWD
jgi:glycosyltransferase involved in cell wall biosynthesis